MFKKVGLAALVAVIGLGLVSRTDVGRWAWSHVRLASSEATNSIKGLASLEYEIKRLDKEIDEIKFDISNSYKPLAREMVEVEQLKKDIIVAEKDVVSLESVVKTARSDRDNAKTKLGVGADAKYERLAKDFALSMKRLDTADKNLRTKKDILQRKEEWVEQKNAAIKAMVERQRTLKAEVAGLRTDLEQVRAAQMKSPVKVEEGRMATIEKDLQDAKSRIAEMKTELSLKERDFNDTTTSVEEKVEQVKADEAFEARFGGQKADVARDK